MLRCSVCGLTYEEATLPWRCACGAPLDWVIGADVRTPDDLSGRPASLWRYREVLPCGNDDGCGPVSLGEGMTPLVRAAWDGAEPVDIGVGGSIPFVAAFAERFPDAAILVTGVEDPDTRAHGANESLHLGEFERVCVAETLLLARLGAVPRG